MSTNHADHSRSATHTGDNALASVAASAGSAAQLAARHPLAGRHARGKHLLMDHYQIKRQAKPSKQTSKHVDRCDARAHASFCVTMTELCRMRLSFVMPNDASRFLAASSMLVDGPPVFEQQ